MSTIRHKRSGESGIIPHLSELSLGEIAINTYDGKLYIKKNDGSESIIEIGAGVEPTGLERIIEGPNEGWRLIKHRGPQSGDIGEQAIDLSWAEDYAGSYDYDNLFDDEMGATGDWSLASGKYVKSSGDYSAALGYYAVADGDGSLAICAGGDSYYHDTCVVKGKSSMGIGNAQVDGDYSFAFGSAQAQGNYSHAEGYYIKSTHDYQFSFGRYNEDKDTSLFELGYGTGYSKRANIFEVLKTGEVVAPWANNARIDAADARVLITREWVESNIKSPTGLELITENGETGWRLVGRDPNNYGDIGNNAIDFSYSESSSTTYGATGNYSVAFGYQNEVSGAGSTAFGVYNTSDGILSYVFGQYSVSSGVYSHAEGEYINVTHDHQFAFGKYNEDKDTSLFELGYGEDAKRANIFEVLKTGEVVAPMVTNTKIDNADAKVLVTKEWVQANAGGGSGTSPTGLEKITENGHTGWRLVGRDPNNYGDIGEQAVDFSYSDAASDEYGATGLYSVVFGNENKANNNYSFAFGYKTVASGKYSFAFGDGDYYTQLEARGDYSHAEGNGNIATGKYGYSFGYQSSASGQHSHAEGYHSYAVANYSTASGKNTLATGAYSQAHGDNTDAEGDYSLAFGKSSIANGKYSFAFGDSGYYTRTTANDNYSFAMGREAVADKEHSFAFGDLAKAYGRGSTVFGIHTRTDNTACFVAGMYNTNRSSTLVEIGNGDAYGESNAFEVEYNGLVIAPELTTGLIDNSSTPGRVLVTKDWVLANAGSPTGLEKLDEGNGSGWRLIGRDPDNFGDIGLNAIDFSESNLTSSRYGSTGDYSAAFGLHTEAAGDYSFAFGGSADTYYNTTIADGKYSFAFGQYATAFGDYAFAFGHDVKADELHSVAIGFQCRASGNHSHAEGEYVRAIHDHLTAFGKYNKDKATSLFELGYGAYGANANAFEVQKTGEVVAPMVDNTKIDAADAKVLVTREWVEANASAINRTIERFTGDGSTTTFTLTNTYEVGKETLVDIFVDGILRDEDYTLSNGDTLEFDDAPSDGSKIIVKILS